LVVLVRSPYHDTVHTIICKGLDLWTRADLCSRWGFRTWS